jgi:hypothetical protein
VSTLRLELGTPEHGWMTVGLQIADTDLRCKASYIVDCITDFACVALELLERRPPRPMILFEEPAATRIACIGDEDIVAVSITRHRDLPAALTARDGTVVGSCLVGRLVLARAMWSALRRLEGAVGRERIEAGWRATFPAKEVAQLGARLRGTR